MGAQSKKIFYQNNLQYIGQTKLVNSEEVPHGSGKIIYSSDQYFQGKFNNGISISGTLTKKNQYKYQGDTIDGKLTGKAKMNVITQEKKEITFQGIFKDGQFQQGKIISSQDFQCQGKIVNLTFLQAKGFYRDYYNEDYRQGVFKKSDLEGIGIYQFPNNDKYSGEFKKGSLNGQGSYSSKKFTANGQFCSGLPNGLQSIVFSNGDKFIGSCTQGKMHGEGTYQYYDGTLFKGNFYHGRTWGPCTIIYPKDSPVQKYEGQIQNQQYNGVGVIQFKNGIIYKGYFYNGMKNGPGIIIFCNSKYQCLFSMDKIIGKPKIFK